MKRVLKVILIGVLCIALAGGSIFAYVKLRKPTPCEVYPAMNWMMSYMPNQTYLYGIVTSDASQVVTKSIDRSVLEILVNPGDVVSVDDPLLRYDATGTKLAYEQNVLELQKLENKLRSEYIEFQKYKQKEYPSPLLTPTPSPSPTPKGQRGRGMLFSAVSAAGLRSAVSGTGTEEDPFVYELGAEDAVTFAILYELYATAAKNETTVFAKVLQPKAEIMISVTPTKEIAFSVTLRSETDPAGEPGAEDPTFPEAPIGGDGSESDPLIYAYTPGTTVPNTFLRAQSEESVNNGQSRFVKLQAERFTIDLIFLPDGTFSFTTVVEPDEPQPTATATASAEPTATATATARST